MTARGITLGDFVKKGRKQNVGIKYQQYSGYQNNTNSFKNSTIPSRNQIHQNGYIDFSMNDVVFPETPETNYINWSENDIEFVNWSNKERNHHFNGQQMQMQQLGHPQRLNSYSSEGSGSNHSSPDPVQDWIGGVTYYGLEPVGNQGPGGNFHRRREFEDACQGTPESQVYGEGEEYLGGENYQEGEYRGGENYQGHQGGENYQEGEYRGVENYQGHQGGDNYQEKLREEYQGWESQGGVESQRGDNYQGDQKYQGGVEFQRREEHEDGESQGMVEYGGGQEHQEVYYAENVTELFNNQNLLETYYGGDAQGKTIGGCYYVGDIEQYYTESGAGTGDKERQEYYSGAELYYEELPKVQIAEGMGLIELEEVGEEENIVEGMGLIKLEEAEEEEKIVTIEENAVEEDQKVVDVIKFDPIMKKIKHTKKKVDEAFVHFSEESLVLTETDQMESYQNVEEATDNEDVCAKDAQLIQLVQSIIDDEE